MDFLKNYNSPLGKIVLTSDGENLTGLYFDNLKDNAMHNFKYTEKDLPIFDETIKWLDIYFKGEICNESGIIEVSKQKGETYKIVF